jgi:hypothetical protein
MLACSSPLNRPPRKMTDALIDSFLIGSRLCVMQDN